MNIEYVSNIFYDNLCKNKSVYENKCFLDSNVFSIYIKTILFLFSIKNRNRFVE